jgi:hypothetical protein
LETTYRSFENMSSPDRTEHSAESILRELPSIHRNLDYLKGVLAAAEEAFSDVCAEFEGTPLSDPEAQDHLASWAYKLSQSLTAVSDISNLAAHKYQILAELTQPRHPEEVEN